MKKTALIILNYNNYEDTINCIESVEKFNTAPIKFVVIDNGSTCSESVQNLDSFFESKYHGRYKSYSYEDDEPSGNLPYLSFVVSKTNDGYAQGNNKGLVFTYLDTDVDQILILNNDILFVEDIIPKLLKFQSLKKNVAIVSPLLYKKNMDGYDFNCARLCHGNWEIILTYLFLYKNILGLIKRWNSQRYLLSNLDLDDLDEIPVQLPSGSCMLISKDLMKEIGGFDPNTFLYYEENILYQKIKRMNYVNYVIPNIKCIHLGASSTKKSSTCFVLRAGLNSASYYLRNYANMTILQRIIWNIAYNLFSIKMKIINQVKG